MRQQSVQGIGHRTLSVGSTTAGGFLVGTNLLAGDFIELLRNKLVLARAGMRILPGLVGNIAIPKQSGAATAYWIAAEGNAITGASQQTFAQVTMSPKTVGAYTDFTRRLLLQSTPAVDGLVQTDLVTVVGLEIDRAGLHGANGSGEPCGIYQVSGIGAPSAANMGWPAAVEFETDVATANADVATMAFIMGASARGTLKKRLKAVNTGIFLVEGDNTLNGYPILLTNQAASGYIFFGDWSQLLLGEWGVEDITIDPYTASTSGTVRVVVLRSCDFGCRQAGAFAVASDLS
jgi:HK97 family phage major capsid protein